MFPRVGLRFDTFNAKTIEDADPELLAALADPDPALRRTARAMLLDPEAAAIEGATRALMGPTPEDAISVLYFRALLDQLCRGQHLKAKRALTQIASSSRSAATRHRARELLAAYDPRASHRAIRRLRGPSA